MPAPLARRQLKPLLSPRTIAVVGASSDENKLGHIVVRNIIDSGFPGLVFPINPKVASIRGLTCYPSFRTLPIAPDLAIIAIPAAGVLAAVKEIALQGTKNLVVFSAGFKEAGEDGVELEKKLAQLAKQYQLNILGPNCLGFVNNQVPLNATFSRVPGNTSALRFLSQSGAIASSVFDWADHTGLGFESFVTLGNKAVLHEHDVLQHWLAESADTYHPLGMYLESIGDGVEFMKLARQAALHSPLFMLKPGKSEAARQAMQSHTGAIAGDDEILSVALEQSGVVRCHGLEDLFDFARLSAWSHWPAGNKVAIISNAGGPAVLSSDMVAEAGLELTDLSPEAKRALSRSLPRAASVLNPIDVLGDALADRYRSAITTVLAQKDVHSILVLLTPQVMTQIEQTAQVIVELSEQSQRPIICSFMGGSQIEAGEKILNHFQIPSFRFPERAIWALGRFWWWRAWRRQARRLDRQQAEAKSNLKNGQEREQHSQPANNQPASFSSFHKSRSLIEKVRQAGWSALNSQHMETLFAEAGIAVPASQNISSLDEALSFAKNEAFPVVLKLASPLLLHKTDVGGVIADINSPLELHRAYLKMVQIIEGLEPAIKKTTQISIQKQISDAIEVLVGIKRDDQFGKVLLFGTGGILTEILDDHQLKLVPVSEGEIEAMILASKIGRVLTGYRGRPAFAWRKLAQAVLRLIQLSEALPVFKEIEINPILVTHQEVWAVDGRAILINR
jgi:acetate---CoA ligase (ADP-forming)